MKDMAFLKDPVLITLNLLFVVLIFYGAKIIIKKEARTSGGEGSGDGLITGTKAVLLGIFYLVFSIICVIGELLLLNRI